MYALSYYVCYTLFKKLKTQSQHARRLVLREEYMNKYNDYTLILVRHS